MAGDISTPLASSENSTILEIRLAFRWEPVLCGDNDQYQFPQPITGFMRGRYRSPAIYRWSVYEEGNADPCLTYIGSAKELCPDRLARYLDPGSSECDRRLNKELHKCRQKGLAVRLEALDLCMMDVAGSLWTSKSLRHATIRLFVEQLLISYYRQGGSRLLNLSARSCLERKGND
jgi:hypothetical protein